MAVPVVAVAAIISILIQQTAHQHQNDTQPELRRIAVNADAVSQNAMCIANLVVDIIAELLTSSQEIKTRLLNESL